MSSNAQSCYNRGKSEDGKITFRVTEISKNAFKNVEYEANLFAVTLLFNESDFNMKVLNMSNYLLKQVLDYNIAVEGKGYLWNFQM